MTLRVFTCTPVRFAGDLSFFSRESGMFSIGLELNGVHSRAVMPGPEMDGDFPNLIRATERDLESPAWWRMHDLDGVVLYSWAAPRFTRVAEAIRSAGIRLCVCMDTSGVISWHANPSEWVKSSCRRSYFENRSLLCRCSAYCRVIFETLVSPIAFRRKRHYRCADVVTLPTPAGLLWAEREARAIGLDCIRPKFQYLPHPQSHDFHYDGTTKQNLVVTVARWMERDHGQKNPQALLDAYRYFLKMRPGWSGLIVGRGATRLVETLGVEPIENLNFLDALSPSDMPAIYRSAKIGFWTSRWEGQQGAAAQALCCGCSVVSHGAAMMSCFRHYVTKASGRIAAAESPMALAEELVLEADAWERGERNASAISVSWTREFHAKNVARRALEYLDLVNSQPQQTEVDQIVNRSL